MFRVGFVDHHLNNWHSDTFIRLLRGPLAGEEIEIVSAWESDPAGDDWCAKNGVSRAQSPEEVVNAVDGVFLLAPDNIYAHLELARRVLPYGKPTFIDKFLAPTSAEAEEIVNLARQHSTPIFSASGLRYAVELDSLVSELAGKRIDAGRFTGMGAWDGYGIHTLTMALRMMGHGVRRIIDTGSATAHTVTLDYGDDRRAIVDVREAENGYEALGWSVAIRAAGKYHVVKITDHEGFYLNLMRHAAGFMKSGTADMPAEEALVTARILEMAEESRRSGAVWMEL